MTEPKLYTCYGCGIESGPRRPLRFVTEIECWACYLIRCREHNEAMIVAAKAVAAMPDSRGRDVLLEMMRK